MKYTAHVPVEQYGFISVEIDGTPEEAVEAYEGLKKASQGGVGLPNKEWNRFLDCYVFTGKPPEDGIALWEAMDSRQRDIVNEVKKVLKRANK